MKKILTLIIIPLLSFGQLFTIDNNYIEIYNLSTVGNFSENTYVNTVEDVTISYEIVTDSMPVEWDFQNCFPDCHPLNTYSIDAFSIPGDTSVYLNGHFYPNNIAGEGLIVMELNANHGNQLDTVTWRGIAMPELKIQEYLEQSEEIQFITNLSGQKIKKINSEKMVIITYKDNRSKMCYILR